MSRKLRTLLTLVLLVGVLAYRFHRDHAQTPGAAPSHPHAVAATKPPPRKLGTIAFTPCTLSPALGASGVEAQCGTLSVAEDPAAPHGRRIALNIAWVPAGDENPTEPDPVFMLAGGPGQSATDTFPQVAPAFAGILKKRNVILVDQRGTGKSNPLACKEEAEQEEGAGGDDATQARTLAQRCLAQLQPRADLRFYTTSDAIRDLDAVRAAIGAAQIDLIGISYGTRVAQQYARRYPQHARALVLDSVAPNTLYLGNEFAQNLEQALDLQFGQCGKVPACAKALGDPRSRLDALMAKLRSAPPSVRYRDASTGEWHEDTLRPEHVAGLIRLFAYTPLAASVLPLQLKEASEGRYDTLMAMARMLHGKMAEQMAMGMQLSVVCSEDAAGFKADPAQDGSLLGNTFAADLGAQCAVWPKGTMPADFHAPLEGDVPAMVLEGEFDPVTPPRYGKAVVATLPRARLFVLRGQGHNVIGAGCMPKLVAQFLDTRDAKALDAKCLDTLPYTPPFTSFNGWEP
ncbi:MAG: alpha/beta fold hydrolase [Lysobacter sp.]|nr:alpha/beta fold hydrolase [Lysobacter sp.]